jgi:hypothetical protein
MVSLVIISVILVAAQSAVLLASRAAPDGRSGGAAALNAARAMDTIAFDVALVKSIVIATEREIKFTVPDRGGANGHETVRYYWSGAPGSDLIRQYNNGAEVTLAQNVQEFALRYTKRIAQNPSTPGEGSEILLAGYTASTGLTDWRMTSSNWIGQYFKPTLPPGAVSWRITRIQFDARVRTTANGEARIQIRSANGNVPSSTIIEQYPVYESAFGASYSPCEFIFTEAYGLLPGAGYCFVITWVSGTDVGEIQYRSSGATATDMNVLTTTTSGSTWTGSATQDMLFSVWGKVTTSGAGGSSYVLGAIDAALRLGSDPKSRISTAIRVSSEPQIAGP